MKILKESRWARIGFLVLLFAVPLYPKFPLLGVKHTYVAIRVTDLVVTGVLGLWLLEVVARRRWNLGQPLRKYFFLFWLAGLLANLSAFWITDFLNIHLAFLHWLRRIEYMAVFFLALDAGEDKETIRHLLRILLLVVFLVFAYGIGQKYFGLPVVSTMNAEFSSGLVLHLDKWVRISSTFAGHYDLAAWLVLVLPLVLALALAEELFWRIVAILIFLAGFQLLVWTASRISFVAYLLAITVTLVIQRRWLLWVLLLAFSLGFGLHSQELNTRLVSTVSPVITFWQKVTSRYHQGQERPPLVRRKKVVALAPTKVSTTVPVAAEAGHSAQKKRTIIREVRTWPKPEELKAATARSSLIRFRVEWPRAWRAWVKNPLWGLGYSSLGLATDCDYLRLLGETGLVGFLAFLLIPGHLLNSFWQAWRGSDRRTKIFLAGFVGSLLGFLANAFFIDVFEASKDAFSFWLLMGLGYKLSQDHEKKTKR